MRIGVCGLGNLGLPLAVAIEQKGHEVYGYDIRPEAMTRQLRSVEAREDGTSDYADVVRASNVQFASSYEELVQNCDMVFVVVQTPNYAGYDGAHKVWGATRKNYEYRYLRDAVGGLSTAIEKEGRDVVVAVTSTVLPGTCREHLLPLLGKHTKLAYNPFTVAMGTVVRDFYHQEFYIMGVNHEFARDVVVRFYDTIGSSKVYLTSIENAELIKVLYNTFITTKICFANTVMEMCHKIPGADCDQVMQALKLARERLISPAYLDGGMVDAGPCHPKDLRSLWWLSQQVGLSFDLFDALVLSAEKQCDWLASLVEAERGELPVVLLGKAFKANSNLDTGSAAYLLAECLKDRRVPIKHHLDPHLDGDLPDTAFDEPACYVLGTKHQCFYELEFPPGSVVIDVFRWLPPKPRVRLVRVGVGPAPAR